MSGKDNKNSLFLSSSIMAVFLFFGINPTTHFPYFFTASTDLDFGHFVLKVGPLLCYVVPSPLFSFFYCIFPFFTPTDSRLFIRGSEVNSKIKNKK